MTLYKYLYYYYDYYYYYYYYYDTIPYIYVRSKADGMASLI